jgi:DNA-binding SARP family transcriptional activator
MPAVVVGSTVAASLEFRILGPLEVWRNGRTVDLGAYRQRSLLVVLLLCANEVVSGDRLIEEVWGEAAPVSARNMIQVYVSRLRKALGPGLLLTQPSGYVLRVSEAELDAIRFSTFVARAHGAMADGEAATARELLVEAIALWRGPPLADFSYESFAQGEAARLEELRLEAIEMRIEADLAVGRDAGLVGELEQLIALHPFRERLRGHLMLALYRCGRQADALDVYQRTRAHLAQELGLEPGPALKALQTAILSQDPSLVGEVPAASKTSPGTILEGLPTSSAPLAQGRDDPDLPASLRVSSPFPFVGRSAELETLSGLMPKVNGEGRRVVLLGGEPGSGKSRLVREFAGEAARRGVLVLYGQCDAIVHTPYGPFTQAIERLAQVIDPVELRAALGNRGGELTRLFPDLPAQLGELAPRVKADPDTERHRLHTAVSDVLERISQQRPIVLVIEDGHWADMPTILLLRHLARGAAAGQLLLLATFRDGDADMPEALSHTLADLRRSDGIVRLELGALSGTDLSEFVRRAGQDRASPDLAELTQAISNLTGGNPFLVCELWRALTETHVVEVTDAAVRFTHSLADLGTPKSVREVVSQRLARLAPTTTALLETAAAAGVEFEVDIVRRSTVLGETELVVALDEAVRSGILEELSARRLSFVFTHELVRRAVYDRLTRVRRAELHLRIGEALEAVEGRSARNLADLAHHFGVAAQLGEVKRAVHYNVLAARAAAEALAFDEAAERLLTALELGIDVPVERAEALLELGRARHRSGELLEALQAFQSAAEIARQLDDAELLAHAAIGYEDASWRPGPIDRHASALLEDAVAAVADRLPELRVRLLGGLARALDRQDEPERAAIVRTNAIALARRLHDRAGLANALLKSAGNLTTAFARSRWLRGTAPVDEILEIVEMLGEARTLAEELGNTEILAEATAWLVPSFAAIGDIASAREELSALREMAKQTGQPFMLHVAEQYGSAIALADGRLEDAAAMGLQSYEAGQMLTGHDASGPYGIHMFSLRREQRRLGEVAGVIRVLAGQDREHGPWRPGLVSLLVEVGMRTEARRELRRITRDGLDPFRESLWLASLTYLTDACAALGEENSAALLYPELEPLAGTSIIIGNLVACYGAADRYLGMLAGTLGDWGRAEVHFERAIALNKEMGAATWLAHTQYEYARLLLTREHGDERRAAALLAEAGETAARIGLTALRARISAL